MVEAHSVAVAVEHEGVEEEHRRVDWVGVCCRESEDQGVLVHCAGAAWCA